MVGPSLIFYYLIFTSTTFSQQILGNKLLLVLKLCINKKKKKKKKNKKTIQENCAWNVQWILAHPIWLYILKKKSNNITKYQNIFTILLFLGFE